MSYHCHPRDFHFMVFVLFPVEIALLIVAQYCFQHFFFFQNIACELCAFVQNICGRCLFALYFSQFDEDKYLLCGKLISLSGTIFDCQHYQWGPVFRFRNTVGILLYTHKYNNTNTNTATMAWIGKKLWAFAFSERWMSSVWNGY